MSRPFIAGLDLSEALYEQVRMFKSSEFAARGLFGLGEPHPRLADRIGHYVLAMKKNFTIKDQILGEGSFQHYGVHGGLSRAEMLVPLIVVN